MKSNTNEMDLMLACIGGNTFSKGKSPLGDLGV